MHRVLHLSQKAVVDISGLYEETRLAMQLLKHRQKFSDQKFLRKINKDFGFSILIWQHHL
jgi:hypothetical protein